MSQCFWGKQLQIAMRLIMVGSRWRWVADGVGSLDVADRPVMVNSPCLSRLRAAPRPRVSNFASPSPPVDSIPTPSRHTLVSRPKSVVAPCQEASGLSSASSQAVSCALESQASSSWVALGNLFGGSNLVLIPLNNLEVRPRLITKSMIAFHCGGLVIVDFKFSSMTSFTTTSLNVSDIWRWFMKFLQETSLAPRKVKPWT